MAAQKVVVEGSNVSASQLKDFFRQINDGSLDGNDIQAILEHRNPWPEIIEVTIGIFKNIEAYSKALDKMGARYILPSTIECAQNPRTIKLERATPHALGLEGEADYVSIVEAALRKGYKLLPAEAAFAFRLACRNLKEREWLAVASEPFHIPEYSISEQSIYHIGCEEGNRFLLNVLDVDPKDKIPSYFEFLFEAR